MSSTATAVLVMAALLVLFYVLLGFLWVSSDKNGKNLTQALDGWGAELDRRKVIDAEIERALATAKEGDPETYIWVISHDETWTALLNTEHGISAGTGTTPTEALEALRVSHKEQGQA